VGGILLCAVVLGLDSSGQVQRVLFLFVCRSAHSFAMISVTNRRTGIQCSNQALGELLMWHAAWAGACQCLCRSEIMGAREDAFYNNRQSQEQ
jgi:hypothetical protein